MDEHPAGVEELVDAIVEGYAPISVILDHMFKSTPHPTVTEVRATLGTLLCDTFEPLATRFGTEDLLTTAAVLEATVPLIHENLHLVPHPKPKRQRRGGRTTSRRH